jgi:folate-binding protein YgfZ
MNSGEIVSATRSFAGLFDMASRGLIEVRGEDRVRWLDGMISGDVTALHAGEAGSGCYATLLTNRGAIIADLHVAQMGEVILLETLRSEIPRVLESLDRLIIADDVDLVDQSEQTQTLGLEGPAAADILEHALGAGTILPTAENWCRGEISDRSVLVAAFGFSGEPGFQLRISPEDRAEVESALDAAAAPQSIVRGDAESLEILRVEAGIPALARELDEEVLPPEARLERAISTNKGCYVGQEIVARLRSRGQVNHLLVGLTLDGQEAPDEGTILSVGGRKTGEITSLAHSPSAGTIALAYVRREHSEPGTAIDFASGRGTVAALPFVPLPASPLGSASDSTAETS